jgi:hypothetical protein
MQDRGDSEPQRRNRRKDNRYPTNDKAEVRVLPHLVGRLSAIVRNVSRSGMHLELHTTLARSTQVEVLIAGKAAIVGEIRYCHEAGRLFRTGVLIRDVNVPPSRVLEHIHGDHLTLYVVGHGLTAPEVIHIREHLSQCDECRSSLADTAEMLRRIQSTMRTQL